MARETGMTAVLAATDSMALGALRWTQVAFGRALTRMRSSATVPRLFKRADLLRFEGVVHEQSVLSTPRPVRRLRQPLRHLRFGAALQLHQQRVAGLAQAVVAAQHAGLECDRARLRPRNRWQQRQYRQRF